MKPDRKQQILEVLARELENRPGSRITTAALAAALGVSEAALYRHFPSKARMFEGLIGFAEDSIFSLLNQVMREQRDAPTRCYHFTLVVLGFAERNPGIARVMMGDALVGEHERLRARVSQLFERLETQFRQVLREEALTDGRASDSQAVTLRADLLMSVVVGRVERFIRTDFAIAPSQDWERAWPLVRRALFDASHA